MSNFDIFNSKTMLIISMLTNFLSIFDLESLIRYGGLLLLFLAVYGQTGLFFCFFLPSGGLMFTAGVFIAAGSLHYDLLTVCSLLTLASMLGNITGYWFGRKTGPLLYKRPDSRFFRHAHLRAAENFYKKHGGLALAGGLFLPIVRTFSPIVAGIIKLNVKQFILFTFIGSALWVSSFVSAGFLIASMPFLKPYLKYIIVGIIITVTIPFVIRIIREFKKAGKENTTNK
jgi:membrane-associated protein